MEMLLPHGKRTHDKQEVAEHHPRPLCVEGQPWDATDSRSLPLSQVGSIGPAKTPLFPEGLYAMVDYCSSHCPNVLDWTADRMGFVIWNKGQLVSFVLPMFFPHMRSIKSFQKQLQNYSFSCKGRKQGGSTYGHNDDMFQCGFPGRAKAIPKKKPVKLTKLDVSAKDDSRAEKMSNGPEISVTVEANSPTSFKMAAQGRESGANDDPNASLKHSAGAAAVETEAAAAAQCLPPLAREARTKEYMHFALAFFWMVQHCETYYKHVLRFGDGGYDAELLKPEILESHILPQFFPRSENLKKWERRVKDHCFVVEKMNGGGVLYRHAARLFHRDDVECGLRIRKKQKGTIAAAEAPTTGRCRACHQGRLTAKQATEGSPVKKRSRVGGVLGEESQNKRVKGDGSRSTQHLAARMDPAAAPGLAALAVAAAAERDPTTATNFASASPYSWSAMASAPTAQTAATLEHTCSLQDRLEAVMRRLLKHVTPYPSFSAGLAMTERQAGLSSVDTNLSLAKRIQRLEDAVG